MSDTPQEGIVIPFPAIDPEPPPPPLWRRLLAWLGTPVVIAVAALVALALWPSGTPTAASNSEPTVSGVRLDLPGRLLVTGSSGALGYTDPEGGRYEKVRGGKVGFGAASSPDGGSVLTVKGTLVTLHGDRATSRLVIPADLWSKLDGIPMAAASPWADHGDHVIMLTAGGGHADVTSVTASGQHVGSLGDNAAGAAGDPRQNAALVVAAGQKLVGHGETARLPGTRLEHRRPGHRTVLISTRRLARMLGLPTKAPYAMEASYSPDGRLIAVVLEPLTSQKIQHGLVVLTRAGQPVFHRTGPDTYSWSHDGSSLAYWTAETRRVRVVDLSGHGRHTVQSTRLPQGSRAADACVWSPDDTLLLCDDLDHHVRSLLDVTSKKTERVSLDETRRVVLAWLPGKDDS